MRSSFSSSSNFTNKQRLLVGTTYFTATKIWWQSLLKGGRRLSPFSVHSAVAICPWTETLNSKSRVWVAAPGRQQLLKQQPVNGNREPGHFIINRHFSEQLSQAAWPLLGLYTCTLAGDQPWNVGNLKPVAFPPDDDFWHQCSIMTWL